MRFNFFPISFSFLIVFVFFLVSPGFSLTVKEERELGQEVLVQIEKSYPVVTDPYINDYINDLGRKIVENSDNILFDFQFRVIRNKTYNAFAVPGGYIFIHTGLIAAMENEAELAGILGHEIGHVTCRHIAQQVEDSKKITAGTLAGVAASILLGLNGADPDAVMGVIAGTQAMGQSAMLAYSRNHEREADSKGLIYLTKSGYSPKGLLTILEKIRSRELWTSSEAPIYLRTHPGTEERIVKITSFINDNKEMIKGLRNVDTEIFSRFNKARIKLAALYQDKNFALNLFNELIADKEKKPLGLYGMALLNMREGEYTKACDYFSEVLRYNALDSELLFDYGTNLFLKGDYDEALNKAKVIKAHGITYSDVDELMGRSYLQLGNYEGAKKVFENLSSKKPDLHYPWYYLGIAYEKLGDKGKAHFSLGKYYEMKNKLDVAFFHYKKASELLDGDQKAEAQKKFEEVEKLMHGKKPKKKK